VALVRLERTPDDQDTLSLIFRLVHTIKGTCGFLGLPRLERVAHAGENVLGRVRDGLVTVTPELVSTVLAAIDRIKAILDGLAADAREPEGDDAALIAALDAISEGKSQAEPVAPEVPADDPLPTTEPALTGQTIRVGVDVLENLMTLASELVLTRNQLLQLARAQDTPQFAVPLQRLSLITSDLQEGVMKTRMQPIGNAWNKLPRLVRDLARDLDKKIALSMLGAETELDRQVLELIRDPLTHMVRNSADHGLELPQERRAAGKSETGRITLNAFHEGGHIVIEIGDDGRGLPVELIRAKVLSRGLASAAELAEMSETQIQRFIFRPGFSTAAAVTSVSGRGVGMDVVKSNIERIGGAIDLASRPGQGTLFTIKIPLTLAIVSALIVEAAGERFAIPQTSVVELVRASAAPANAGDPAVQSIDGTKVLRLRDRLLPLVELGALLRLGAADGAAAGEESLNIVIAQVGASLLGIVVDRVFDTEEIVVKPVAPVLRHIAMFSGNTILGDGSVIMILDPNGIARAAGIGAGETRASAAPEEAGVAAAGKTALLLFRAGGELRAVPLGLVARLEEVEAGSIEYSAGQPLIQYRGRLMPLVAMSGMLDGQKQNHPVLVFTDADNAPGQSRSMGLVVDEIIDTVEDHLDIELTGGQPGLLGSAVIAGRATDVVDIGHWLTRAFQDWFRGGHATSQAPRVLVVEDSGFFRQLLAAGLSAAGYDVTEVPDAAGALKLRDGGAVFDAIVSDIEMPAMNGLEFVARLRGEGSWRHLPVIALTRHDSAAEIAAGRAAGFTDYVRKFEREALLASLRQCLAARDDARLAA
jgi:two-component system, chemotaxis family, sensor kinase CheA